MLNGVFKNITDWILLNSCKDSNYTMRPLLFLSISLFFSVQLRAQSNVSELAKMLTEEALKKNYELSNSQLEGEKTEQDIKSAKATYIPKINAVGAYAYLNQDLTVDLPSIQTGISGLNLFEGSQSFGVKGQVGLAAVNAEMVLFSGMQAEYGSKALMEKKQAQEYLSLAKKNEITQDILETIDQIALLHQSKLLLDESQKRLDKENLRVKKAIENGLAIPYDRKKIEVAIYRLEAKKQEYDGKRELLFSKLSMLTGHSAEELEKQTSTMNELSPWLFVSSESVNENSTVMKRPEVHALNSGIQAVDYQIKMQKAKALPQVIAMGSVGYTNLHNARISTPYHLPVSGQDINLKANKIEAFPNYIVGVGVKWNLFSGTQRSHELKKLTIEKTIAENHRKDINEKLDLLLQKSRTEFRLAEKQMQLKEKEKIVSEDALSTAVKSYQEGLISITERIEAENSLQQSQMEYVQAVLEQRKAALSYLNAQGTLQLDNL